MQSPNSFDTIAIGVYQNTRDTLRVSRLNSTTDTRPRSYLLSTIFKEIEHGNAALANLADDTPYRTLRQVTQRARDLRYQHGNKKAYDLLKREMPQFIPAAVLSGRSEIHAFSHLVCLEWDGDVDTAHALMLGKQHPNVLAIWKSLSGNPKFLIPVTPVSKDGDDLTKENYKHAWYSVACLFEEIGEADTSAMSPTQPQALCYDPDVYVNWEAVPVDWDIDEIALDEAYPNLIKPDDLAYAELPVEYHIAIQEMFWKSDEWGETSVPCPWGSHENDGWESASNGTGIHKNGENDFTFHCFKCPKSVRYSEKTKHPKKSKHIPGINPIKALPADHPILKSAPPLEVRETPSFRYFSPEERHIVKDVLSLDPDAGWHGQTPIFTTRYEYLHPLTNKFALNGQPSEVEKRRVWSTLFGNCELCGVVTARWIDRYLLTAGVYCDGCHKDYPLGSYLELELNRKLPNSIVSEHQGFLGDDPEFADFRLWEPGTLTHLGAAMSTGKSTELDRSLEQLATAGLGKGIIAVPLVALARFMTYYLRQKHGYRSWGLWHEGCDRDDRFIGDIGAIVCLPSLPRAAQFAQDEGVDRLYVALDEVDFGYNLLSLTVNQATAVKACLREATAETGLVVSGQTESTLALEAFAEEVEADNVQGFYNTAPRAEGSIVLHKHPDTDGKSNAILSGGIDDTSKALSEGHNVYAFCSERRDVDIIANEFESENPVIYNAYTKGEARADAVLRNQKLTDSRLFVATSAAGLGISILDAKAHTVVIGGLLYGSRQANMLVQEHVRDRGRRGGDFHYTDYQFSLPISPTDNQHKSLYHESLKQNLYENSHLPTAGIRKLAYAQALASLADSQIETFLAYHLATVGNIPVHQASALETDTERLAVIASKRSEIRRTERETKTHGAVELLNDCDLLTTSEIRKLSNKGQLSTDQRLAYELANFTACAVGWNDEIDRFNGESIQDILTQDDFDVAILLAEKNINTDKLTKQRRGYMAVHFPKWTAHQLKSVLENTQKQMVINGAGIEITAVSDDRMLGELLKTLSDRIQGKVFDSTSLANATREVLKMTSSSGKSFETEIQLGALGASAYRKARFLNCADDDRIVEWVRMFISEWYPVRIAKSDENYALQHPNDYLLRLSAFHQWLSHQPGVPEGTQPDFEIIESTELPDPDAGLRDIARFRREGGETIKAIAESLNRNPRTIAKWCDGIKPPPPTQRDVLSILGDGEVWKASDIEKHSRFVRQKVTIALKNLLNSGQIRKTKRGYYQKFDP